MNLSGTLTDWTVADLLNVMKVTGKTASLHIKGRRTGVIHFSAGRVVGAALDGDAVPSGAPESRAAASDVLFVLSAVDDGTFEVGPLQGIEAEGWDVDSLLADMSQLDELESDLIGADMRDALLMLRDEISEPITIQVEDWWALASLVSVLSFEQLEEVFGRGRAIRLLHTLWRMNLIETVQEEEDEDVEPGAPVDSVPLLADEEPPSVDLSELSEKEPEEEAAPVASVEPGSERDDESWLDEIAAAAEAGSVPSDLEVVTRNVMGVSAPASTVLTGGVLDEMRRLRVRPSQD